MLLALVSGVLLAACGLLTDEPCDSPGCTEEMAEVERAVAADDRVREVQEVIYLPLGPGIGQAHVRVTLSLEPDSVDDAENIQELVVDAVEEQQIEDLEEVVLRIFVDGEEIHLAPDEAALSFTF